MCWIKVDWNGIWMNWVVCGVCEAKWPLESHRGDLAVPHQVSVVCFNIDTHTLDVYWDVGHTQSIHCLLKSRPFCGHHPPTRIFLHRRHLLNTRRPFWKFYFFFWKNGMLMLFDVWTARGLWGCRVSTQLSPWQGRWSRSLQGHGRLNGRNSVVDCPASLEQKPFG